MRSPTNIGGYQEDKSFIRFPWSSVKLTGETLTTNCHSEIPTEQTRQRLCNWLMQVVRNACGHFSEAVDRRRLSLVVCLCICVQKKRYGRHAVPKGIKQLLRLNVDEVETYVFSTEEFNTLITQFEQRYLYRQTSAKVPENYSFNWSIGQH
jgi:hypothetical protein